MHLSNRFIILQQFTIVRGRRLKLYHNNNGWYSFNWFPPATTIQTIQLEIPQLHLNWTKQPSIHTHTQPEDVIFQVPVLIRLCARGISSQVDIKSYSSTRYYISSKKEHQRRPWNVKQLFGLFVFQSHLWWNVIIILVALHYQAIESCLKGTKNWFNKDFAKGTNKYIDTKK